MGDGDGRFLRGGGAGNDPYVGGLRPAPEQSAVSVLAPEGTDARRLAERRDAHRDIQQAAAHVLLGGFGPDDDIDQRLAEAEHAGGHQWARAASGSPGPRSWVNPSL